MKRVAVIIFLFFSLYARSQVFTGTGGGIQNLGQDTYFNLSVSGLSPAQLGDTFGIKEVCININHPVIEELYIYLQSPAGNIVELIGWGNCKGVNYTNTCFDSQMSTSITSGTAPYSGSYRPIGYLGRFNTGQAANGSWNLIVHDGVAFVNSGNVVSWSIRFGSSPSPPVGFSSSNLPIVIMNTNSQPLSNSKILINMGIIDNGLNRNYLTNPWNNYSAKAMTHIRGSSTKNFEKKSYSFETRDASGIKFATHLLGMPLESDWELLAPYQDKSLMRISITYDLYRRMGNYASRLKNVELVLNNEYQGVYTIAEKLKRDSRRVHVTKLTPVDNSFPAITGGYIFKIDRSDAAGWSSLLPGDSPTNSHFYYQYVYPTDTNLTIPQKAYIKSYVDSFETALASPSFADPLTGYSKYIDIVSFIDFFIINELSKNVDAYRLSTYMYKDNILKGGKLHIGPVWDYDIAWHNCDYGNAFDPTGWQYQIQDTIFPTPTWWNRFMQDTSFVNALYCRWNQLRKDILSIGSLNAYVDSSANALNESQQRNFVQWPILGAYIYPNPQNQSGANYQGEVNDLKNWIASRIGWMDGAITGHCVTGIEENNIDNSVAVYPNPSGGMFNVRWANLPAGKQGGTNPLNMGSYSRGSTIEIYNMLGEKIYSSLTPRPSPLNIDLSSQPKGIYFYQLKINGSVKSGKLIIR